MSVLIHIFRYSNTYLKRKGTSTPETALNNCSHSLHAEIHGPAVKLVNLNNSSDNYLNTPYMPNYTALL